MGFELPKPRRAEISIFGVDAYLSERTMDERRNIEQAFSKRNGADSDVLTYALTFAVIVSALECNIRKYARWNIMGRLMAYRWNRLWTFSYLNRKLAESQVLFLIDLVHQMDYGDAYEEVKKKFEASNPNPKETRSMIQQSRD